MSDMTNVSTLKAERPHKEVRFAVVMYGGVSLAIYIHGVAQELLSLVRATARKKDGAYWIEDESELKGAELVYRCLGETLRAKFVVDILSGTSAGGINAVYLAKALVNDKSMDGLKELWIQEGDISKLINDEESILGLSGLGLNDPPDALLNSQRMYFKLLQALKMMGSSDAVSPYVDELDLNITATDIRGLNLPIRIRNRSINELRYKTVFRFKYRTEKTFTEEQVARNDFKKEQDPFLAFAARCTSSIPPAFEAVQLRDIEPVLKTSSFRDEYRTVMNIGTDEWRDFYADYVAAGDAFASRSFGDGGYLDNKPFSYATEDLLTRRADLPVDRKLLYIEPSPEHPENRPFSEDRPNMVENLLAALVGLPRQETIREDLASILSRNEDINRTNKIFAQVNDVFNKILSMQSTARGSTKKDNSRKNNSTFQEKFRRWGPTRAKWANKYLDQLIDHYGFHYPAYHQLRMENVLDTLALISARGMGWDENGQEARDLRVLLTAWREKYYATNSMDAKEKETKLRSERPADSPKIRSENEILHRLDIGWRRRRTYFLQRLANVLLDSLGEPETRANENLKEQAETLQRLSGTDWSDSHELRAQYRSAIEDLKEKFNLIDVGFERRINKIQKHGLIYAAGLEQGLQNYANQLMALRELLTSKIQDSSAAGTVLQEFASQLRSKQRPGDARLNDVLDHIEKLSVLLSPHSEEKVEDSSAYYIKDALRHTAIRTTNALGKEGRGGQVFRGYLEPKNPDIPQDIYAKVQKCLRYFYERFEYYDMLIYPLQFGADFGESDEVEIIRVSPEDATMLVDEGKTGRLKLAGTKLANFGAFFKQEWRENDMLWGRLDAVELLLKELLVDNGRPEKTNLQKLRSVIWGRLSPDEQARYGTEEKLDPFEFAFERILEQDLRPRDRALFYDFFNGDSKPSLDARKVPSAAEPKIMSPALAALVKQKKQLEQLEAELRRFQSDKGPDRLEADLYHILQTRPNLGLDQLNQKLAEQIKEVAKQKAELEERIKSEEQKLVREAKEEAKQNQRTLDKLDDAGDVLQSVPEAIRKKSQDLLAEFKKTDTILYRDLLRAVAKNGELLHYFRHGYSVNQGFEPEETIAVAERSARTLSRLLQGLSDKYPIQRPVGFLTFVLQIVTAIINLALPKKFTSFLFFGYWIWLLYVAEGIIWLAGTITNNVLIANVGSTALVITVALHFLVFQINRLIVKASRRNYVVWMFYGVALAVWVIGLWLNQDALAKVGWVTLAIIAGIHVASNVGRRWPKLRWLRPALVGLLTLAFLAIFSLGLAYLGIIEPTGWLADFLGSARTLFSK